MIKAVDNLYEVKVTGTPVDWATGLSMEVKRTKDSPFSSIWSIWIEGGRIFPTGLFTDEDRKELDLIRKRVQEILEEHLNKSIDK